MLGICLADGGGDADRDHSAGNPVEEPAGCQTDVLVAEIRRPTTVSAMGCMAPAPTPYSLATLTDHDLGVAQWVFDNGERAGRGTDTLPSASSLFVPLRTRGAIVGTAVQEGRMKGQRARCPMPTRAD